MSGRQSRNLSMAKADMARGGLKEGSAAWDANINNIMKEQNKERKQLGSGATAMDLQGKNSPLYKMSQMDYDTMRKTNMYQAGQGAKQAYQKANQTWSEEGYQQGKGPGDRDTLVSGAMKSANARFDKTARAQYDKGEWFQPTYETTGQGAEGQGGYKRQTGEALTPGGALRMSELTSSADNPYGRELAPWEAVGFMQYGAPGSGQTEEEKSFDIAKSASSGQKQAGRDKASAAEVGEEQKGTASPWIVKQEETLF